MRTSYEQTFFPSAHNFFPFSNLNPFPFEPKETKIREDNFSEMKEREESSSLFVVGERIYNVKFNMNAQTWLLSHYWLFLLMYFFPPRGGLGPKGCVGPTLMRGGYYTLIHMFLCYNSNWVFYCAGVAVCRLPLIFFYHISHLK